MVQGWLAADWPPSGPTGPEHPWPVHGSRLKTENHRNKRLVQKRKNKITTRLCSDWRSQTHTSSPTHGLTQTGPSAAPPGSPAPRHCYHLQVPHTLALTRPTPSQHHTFPPFPVPPPPPRAATASCLIPPSPGTPASWCHLYMAPLTLGGAWH